jgi:hypothetical protein
MDNDRHRSRRTNGGFAQIPNRWIDAGYMKSAPGSVTQVYLHLSRWAENDTDEAAQPMALIARQCGLSLDHARKAIRILEEWGVIRREPKSGRNGVNVWLLLDLPVKAPPYPQSRPPGLSTTPRKTSTPTNQDPKNTPPLYQTNPYHPKRGSNRFASPAASVTAKPPKSEKARTTGASVDARTTDRRVWDAVAGWFDAKNVPYHSVPDRERYRVFAEMKHLPDWAGRTDVRDCVAYLQSDPFYREPGKLTVRKLCSTILEWDGAGRPEAVAPRGRPAGPSILERMMAQIAEDEMNGGDDKSIFDWTMGQR